MSNVLVIGISPAKVTGEKNRSLKRLKRWFDEVGLVDYEFYNLIPKHTSKPHPKKVDWDTLGEKLQGDKKIIALGTFVDQVLYKIYGPFSNYLKIEHPSGCNRNLNDKKFEEAVILSLKRYLEENE